MPQQTLEERVSALEEAMASLVSGKNGGPIDEAWRKDWRRTFGMFDGDPVMAEIQEEGRKIREAEREAIRQDTQL